MKNHYVRWVVVPFLLLMPASVLGQTAEEIEDLFWRSVECQSARQVQAYLQEFPEGRYLAEARACLEQQRLQKEREIEDVFWRSVECQSRLQVQAYLETYPTGRYVAEARMCLEGQLGLDRAARVLVQQGLAAVGHDPGPADGLFGAGSGTRTRQVIRAWQAAKGMPETGYLTREQADTLIAVGQEAEETERAAQAQAEQVAREAAEQQAQEADDTAYVQAQRLDTVAAYADYLRAYPQGRHVQEARARQTALQEATRQAQEAARRAQADDAAYAAAEQADTAEGYEEYLRAYPQGQHVAEARRRKQQRQWRAGQMFSDELRSGGQGPEMVVVPAGSFMMGCVSGQDCWEDEHPVHEVKITRTFAVGKYEVTFAEWDTCVSGGGCNGYRPDDKGWGRGRRPVINVSWEDAVAYTRWLNNQTGQPYRLLSEAEWEYVARAGTTTSYNWGDSIEQNRANCDGCGSQWEPGFFSGGRTAPVGSFSANRWGLYDVHGNVFEWVRDCWNEDYNGAPSDGRAWESGDCRRRVLRGGSWPFEPRTLRSAYRSRDTAIDRFHNIGFRIARTLP